MRRKIVLFAVAAVAGSVSVACGGGATSAAGAFDPATCQGGTLTVLNQRDESHLDPARLYTSGGGNIPSLLFRTLTTRTRAGGQEGTKVAPDLATNTGEPSDDAKTWTYHLRDGLKFDDGTPITAQDVKYGIERSFSPELPGGAPYLRDWLVGAADYKGVYAQPEGIAAIETPDEKTIVFRLRKPQGDFPYLATATQFSPVPKARDTGTNYENKPVSSGPYRIERFEKNKELVLARNEHWSRSLDPNRLACPDRVEIHYGLNPAVINQRIASGSGADANAVTTTAQLGPDELARLDSDPELARRVARGNFPYTWYLSYDTTKAPFDNPKVRQAFTYAVNRQAVINAAGGSSLAYPATTFLPEQEAMGFKKYDFYPAGETGDPEKARQLLAEAGYPNGIEVTLAHSTQSGEGDGPEVASAIQDAYKRAGITVKLQGIDASSYSTTIANPATQPQIALSGWGADWPSGGPFLIPVFDGRQILASGGNFNLAHHDDPEVNAEIDEITRITDPKQAAKRWGELDEKLGRKALVVPLFHGKDAALFGKNVKNAFVSDWTGKYDLSALSVK
ncbi:peptide/nickel transport system substrate-binding protein [Streptoalloteichus tenebrarius]|uniref:Peptide/nickel transport system substrate-binding protein n=1 Tax=Streptoalloteichus tenebrarius (strain ATCC 17920 / DSM 40477 / JCM 4838 / CBS 697.72 / NBRC 16177 / NCIMB 11028 / NRRL B-12390 / A12253. 1 / ISP 5477) TaxID=1933 RepID=A0ABT1HS50_STRSD|nr:ABC transporter substrate-binding protein [Streptoalloteichus tenebrarius]MCP2258345.1 peptide/nickel transport system substrate-binding protein [Streptoalloteichus tenebrarius]BFF03511.1 ABC transporter substrate-binding protein [Streptoalloteichus tenebrarius]